VATALTAMIAVATIIAVLTRPRGINEGAWALSGAVILVALGRLPFEALLDALQGLLGVLAFLFGLFWLTLAADRAGLFDRAAIITVRAADGSSARLLAAVFVLGTLTTALLSNDATVVLVTPVILRVCRRLALPPLPYLVACTFVADTASSLLPISNPVNLLYAERLGIDFLDHVTLLAIPTIAAVAVNWAVFHYVFRPQLPRRFTTALMPSPGRPAPRAAVLILSGLLIIGVTYGVAAFAGVSAYWVTLAGGAVLAGLSVAGGLIRPVELARVQPPSLYAFVVGLAVIVAASDHAGLIDALGRGVVRATEAGTFSGLVAIAFGTALGTNVVNNWTMALAIVPALERANASDLLIAGSMLGADIGPNLSVVGSLATLIWLTEVRREGLAISGWTYLRLGLVATLPALAVATTLLYVVYALIG
jgi:arsenical pump membrane protein